MRPPSDLLTRCRSAVSAAVMLTVGLAACVHRPGQFVWVDQLDAKDVAPATGAYVFGPGDHVALQVFNHPEISGRTRVRDDGKLSVPLLGEVPAAGRAPAELARDLETQLGARQLVVSPRVTVQLEEPAPLRVSVLGEVVRPGLYTLETGAGLAQAIASAGGFTDFSHRDRVYVVRRAPTPVRIRFTYEALARAQGQAAAFRLRPGDVVVAE